MLDKFQYRGGFINRIDIPKNFSFELVYEKEDEKKITTKGATTIYQVCYKLFFLKILFIE